MPSAALVVVVGGVGEFGEKFGEQTSEIIKYYNATKRQHVQERIKCYRYSSIT